MVVAINIMWLLPIFVTIFVVGFAIGMHHTLF